MCLALLGAGCSAGGSGGLLRQTVGGLACYASQHGIFGLWLCRY